jgi:hypothetical protein
MCYLIGNERAKRCYDGHRKTWNNHGVICISMYVKYLYMYMIRSICRVQAKKV